MSAVARATLLFKYNQLEVRRLTMKNYPEILNLITKDYSQDHGIDTYGDIENMDEFNAVRIKMKLQQPWSVGIYKKITKELLAVSMNTIESKPLVVTEDDYQKFGYRRNSKQLQIDRFFDTVHAHVFDNLGVDRVFYLGMSTVRSKYRRNNLFSLLSDVSHQLAWEAGCKYIVVCPTTEILCQSMERSGWGLLREIKFADYDAEHGTNLFENARYPNVRAQLLYKMVAEPLSEDIMPVAML